MNNNLINKTIDWSINAINNENTFNNDQNLLFRILIVCLFFIFYIYFILIVNKIIPIVYNNCKNIEKGNCRIYKTIELWIKYNII